MTFPAITPLPTAPSRTQTPDAFATTADTFVASLPELVTNVNAAGAYIDTKSISVGNTFKGDYSAGTTYAQGESILYSDGKFYLSLVGGNTGNTPSAAPSFWVEIFGAATPAPVSGSQTFTASGAIAAGDAVGMNPTGTVSKCNPIVGTAAVFESANTGIIASAFDPSTNRVVIAYRDNGNSLFGTAVVGTISGDTVTFGTPVVFASATTTPSAVVFDSSTNKIVILYRDALDYPTAIVGTVSGTSISFGTAVTIVATASSFTMSGVFDPTNNSVVAFYNNGSYHLIASVGTVSGTSISFGAAVTVESATIFNSTCVFNTTGSKVVVGYALSGNFGVKVGTVSGTSISFGTGATLFNLGEQEGISSTYDSSTDNVIFALAGRNLPIADNYNTIVFLGKVSGTGITLSSASKTALLRYRVSSFTSSMAFDPNTNLTLLATNSFEKPLCFISTVGNVPQIIRTTPSGSAGGNDGITNSNNPRGFQSLCFDTVQKRFLLSFCDYGNSAFGTSLTVNPASTSFSWVGFSKEAIADGASGSVAVVSGTEENQTGLTVGSKYYLSNSGTVTTTLNAGREVGRALSATKLLVTQGSIE